MSKVKQEAIRMIRALSDDSDWSDLAYQLYVRSAIEEGLADLAAGRVATHEEVKRRAKTWFKSSNYLFDHTA